MTEWYDQDNTTARLTPAGKTAHTEPGDYWIDDDPIISPRLDEIKARCIPSVRVMRAAPPFALGEVVCFFVGDNAAASAEAFCRIMNEETIP